MAPYTDKNVYLYFNFAQNQIVFAIGIIREQNFTLNSGPKLAVADLSNRVVKWNCRNFRTKHQSMFNSNFNSKLNFKLLIFIFFSWSSNQRPYDHFSDTFLGLMTSSQIKFLKKFEEVNAYIISIIRLGIMKLRVGKVNKTDRKWHRCEWGMWNWMEAARRRMRCMKRWMCLVFASWTLLLISLSQ